MKIVLSSLSAVLLANCAYKDDQITFVSATQLGIGVDATTSNAVLGYDRTELVVAPVDTETGETNAIYADFGSKGSFLTPSIKQTLATGKAARRLVDPAAKTIDSAGNFAGVSGTKTLVFGTTTNVGLKLSGTSTTGVSINLGYKRKEVSVIPLNDGTEIDDDGNTVPKKRIAPSLFAGIAIDVNGSVGSAGGTSISQVIATGQAAENAVVFDKVQENAKDRLADVTAQALLKDGSNCLSGQKLVEGECVTDGG